MKTLYFDCFSGISGDMTVGALLDLGIDKEKFLLEMKKLNLNELSLCISKMTVNGITGTDFTVNIHSHGHSHEHRHLSDVLSIIDGSSLGPRAKELSRKIFLEIAEAEAKVHGTGIEQVHFHEVGALDSIADIIGAAVCIEMLGVDQIYCSELHDGRGMIECAHGKLPVPVPAVMEMLKGSGIPLIQEEIQSELVTPTGMAIIKTISNGFGKMPPIAVAASGTGFGKRETGRLNALRVIMGTAFADNNERTVILESNIDNMTPEDLSFAMERLFEAGALDVWFTPIYMKKNRPAVMLSVLAEPSKKDMLADTLFINTASLGIRIKQFERKCLKREFVNADTKFGKINVKVSVLSSGEKRYSPEYEDCRAAAVLAGVPISVIRKAAIEACREK